MDVYGRMSLISLATLQLKAQGVCLCLLFRAITTLLRFDGNLFEQLFLEHFRHFLFQELQRMERLAYIEGGAWHKNRKHHVLNTSMSTRGFTCNFFHREKIKKDL